MSDEDFGVAAEEALRFTRQVQQCLVSDLWFALAIMQAPVDDVAAFKRCIKLASQMRSGLTPQKKVLLEELKRASRNLRHSEGSRHIESTTPYRKQIRVPREEKPDDE